MESYERRLEREKAASLGQVLMRTARLFNERAIRRFREHPEYRGIGLRHTVVFPHLDLEGTRITTLAQRMDMTKQGAGQLVTELEEAGLVERVPDATDGRAKLVRFTERGRAALLDGIAELRAFEEELAAVVGRAELTRLRHGLLKLGAALEG